MARHILFVDDDALIQKMVRTFLERHGYRVTIADDGEEGLDRARKDRPDLIITDILMPKLDGWSFVEKLRGDRNLMLVPVIFLTALDNPKDRFHGFRLGAEDYLPKPFIEEKLLESVEKVLSRLGKFACGPGGESQTMSGKAGFEGDLEQMSFATILTVLEMERNSGILLFKSHREGCLYLQNGSVHDVRFEDDSGPVGKEAIYDMLSWRSGKFEFYYMEVEREDRVNTPTTALLLEGARRLDETKNHS
jgi:DNA-binding response OmpR family regulator